MSEPSQGIAAPANTVVEMASYREGTGNRLSAAVFVEDARQSNPGGGGGGMDTLEPRVTKLEATLSDFRVDTAKSFGDLRERMTRTEGKVDQLPTKDWVDEKFGKLLTRVGLVVGLVVSIVTLAGKLI